MRPGHCASAPGGFENGPARCVPGLQFQVATGRQARHRLEGGNLRLSPDSGPRAANRHQAPPNANREDAGPYQDGLF